MAEQGDGDPMSSRQTPAGKRAASKAQAADHTNTDLPEHSENTAETRWRRTALAAFYRAEARGFAPGRELDDWLDAERELEALESARKQPAAATDSAPAHEQSRSENAAAPARKRAPSKRTKAPRGANLQARNRGDVS
jgi:hypothetical protein